MWEQVRTRLRRPAPTWPALVPWGLSGACAGFALVRVLGLDRGALLVQAISFTPYLMVGALFSTAIAVVCRRGWAVAVAGLAALVLLAGIAPRGLGDPSPAVGTPLRLASVNLLLGGADAQSIVDLVRDERVDVLAVQELTPREEASLDAAGLDQLLPHRELHSAPRAAGSGLYSRFPLADGGFRVASPGGYRQAYALVEPPGTEPVHIESVHPVPPINGRDTGRWAAGLQAQLPGNGAGPRRILVGDFNATLDHSELRRLLATGYRDAADEVGAGFNPTWPFYGRRSLVTPRITLDHVLVPEHVGVRAVTAVTIPHTDHRAILATLTL